MKSKKWFVLLMIVMFAAVLVVGCGGSEGNNNEPDDEPVVGATIPHSIEDEYEDCMSCHDDIAESHAEFEGYEDNCLDCHAQE